MIEKLKKRLEAITGTDPVSIARRAAIIAKIEQLIMNQQ